MWHDCYCVIKMPTAFRRVYGTKLVSGGCVCRASGEAGGVCGEGDQQAP